jgi:hypothetical protein
MQRRPTAAVQLSSTVSVAAGRTIPFPTGSRSACPCCQRAPASMMNRDTFDNMSLIFRKA